MIGTEEQALMKAIRECAVNGREWDILNSDQDVVWSIEADTPVDENDLTRPVIVHMRGGTLATEGIAILMEREPA